MERSFVYLRLLQGKAVWFPPVLETEMLLDGTLHALTDFPNMPPSHNSMACLVQLLSWAAAAVASQRIHFPDLSLLFNFA